MDSINAHIDGQIKSGGQPKFEKLFNLSKNGKEDAPLNGFVEYYAYLTEERKYKFRYPGRENKDSDLSYLQQPIHPTTGFNLYVGEKHLDKREYYISEAQYVDLDFMNMAPEIVCEVLYYLCGYVHHRTSSISIDTYKDIMMAQIDERDVATKAQLDHYEREGWMQDPEGIDKNIAELKKFVEEFRMIRDAKPTPEESLRARYSCIQMYKKMGISLSDEDLAIEKNFDNLMRSIISKKGSTAGNKGIKSKNTLF